MPWPCPSSPAPGWSGISRRVAPAEVRGRYPSFFSDASAGLVSQGPVRLVFSAPPTRWPTLGQFSRAADSPGLRTGMTDMGVACRLHLTVLESRFGALAASEMAQALGRMLPTESPTANGHAGLRIKMY